MRTAITILLAAILTSTVACSASGDDSISESEAAISERTADRGEIAYGTTKEDNYISDNVPSWRFRGRQGDIIEVTLDGGVIGSHDFGNSDYGMEILVQDMGGNPLVNEAARASRQEIKSVSLRYRLPYNGNYFLLARNTTRDRATLKLKLSLLAGAGKLFDVTGKGTQKNISLTRAPDCTAIVGASSPLPAQDTKTPLAVALDGTVSVVPPTVGRCSPQTLPELATPVSDTLDVSIEDPTPPWQVACTGPKPLTYKLKVVPQQDRPPYAGARTEDKVTITASCEDLAGRTEYSFTGALPHGVF